MKHSSKAGQEGAGRPTDPLEVDGTDKAERKANIEFTSRS
jgi:hypothetical protein